jgi:hypothetical protein
MDTIDVEVGGETRIGRYPPIPLRLYIRGQVRRAMGYTAQDEAAEAAREPDDPPVKPSGTPNGYALQACWCALPPLCGWPVEGLRPFSAYGHNVVEYGAAAADLYQRQKRRPGAMEDLIDSGRGLFYAMIADAVAFFGEVEAAEDPTEAPAGPSTSA